MTKVKVTFEFDEGQLSDAMEKWGPFPSSVKENRKVQILGAFLADFLVQGGLYGSEAELLGIGIEARRGPTEPPGNGVQSSEPLHTFLDEDGLWLRKEGFRDILLADPNKSRQEYILAMDRMVSKAPFRTSIKGNFTEWSDGKVTAKLIDLVVSSEHNGQTLEWPRNKN